jgi:hypothetical protein
MIRTKRREHTTDGGTVIQFSVLGLVVFSVSLVMAAAVAVYTMDRSSRKAPETNSKTVINAEARTNPPASLAPWGDLITSDVQLDPPDEYLAFELENIRPEVWRFPGLNSDQVRAELERRGLSTDQVRRAMELSQTDPSSGTSIRPDDALVLSLSTAARSKLYEFLSLTDENHYMRYPFCFPGTSFDACFSDGGIKPETLSLVRQLLYPRGEAQFFSDFPIVMRKLPAEERTPLLQALSRQSAVLARLHVGADTDIDKVLGYWDRGIQIKDVRPLLESLKRLPSGGTVSVLYLLPQFARQRLYTFPQPSNTDDRIMDCHWSTMNFFNETPDDRFANPEYTVKYLEANYYRIARPTAYGDLIFFLDGNGHAIHSGVYLANDILFTKNGNNIAQPWMLMRLNDVAARYQADTSSRMIVYRNRAW